MNKNFFKQVRILDGGMGQELLARGLNPKGTLWSAKALLEEKTHSLIESVHEDFVKAGAEVIVTTTFASRKIRLRENKVEDKFEYLNKKAITIQVIINKNPDIGDSIAMIPNPVATPLPPENFNQIG